MMSCPGGWEDLPDGDQATMTDDDAARNMPADPVPKAKSKALARGKADTALAGAAKKQCFACEARVVGNQRWCEIHKRIYQALHKHAKDQGADAVSKLNTIMNNAVTAREYMAEHLKNNPGGKYSRINIIDWSQWLRRYKEARESRARVGEREFDIKSWLRYSMDTLGNSEAESLDKWNKYKERSDIEKSGDGANHFCEFHGRLFEEPRKLLGNAQKFFLKALNSENNNILSD